MEWWDQGVFTWPLLACLDLCQISLPGTEDRRSESRPAGVHHVCRVSASLRIGSRMSEHRGREAFKQMGPAQFLDLFFLLAIV